MLQWRAGAGSSPRATPGLPYVVGRVREVSTTAIHGVVGDEAMSGIVRSVVCGRVAVLGRLTTTKRDEGPSAIASRISFGFAVRSYRRRSTPPSKCSGLRLDAHDGYRVDGNLVTLSSVFDCSLPSRT